MAENPAAYVGDDVTSANAVVLTTGTAINLMHDQAQLEPYIHVMLQSTHLEPEHYGVMLEAYFHYRCALRCVARDIETPTVFLFSIVLVVQRFGVGLVIERSLVRLPAGALSSQLGQLSLPSLRGR